MTGPQTRKWLMDRIAGEGTDDYTYTPPAKLDERELLELADRGNLSA